MKLITFFFKQFHQISRQLFLLFFLSFQFLLLSSLSILQIHQTNAMGASQENQENQEKMLEKDSTFKRMDLLGPKLEKDFFIYKNNLPQKKSPIVIDDNDDGDGDGDGNIADDIQKESGYIKNLKLKAKNENKFYIDKIILEGVKAYPKEEIENLYKNSLKRDYSFLELKKMLSRITRYYRKDGYMLAVATVPDQKVIDDTIKILIVEGTLEKLIIQNDPQDPVPERVLNFLTEQMSFYLETGAIVNQRHLENFLVLANQISGTSIKIMISPSENQIGGVILTIIARHESSFTINYQANNYGSTTLGTNMGKLSLEFHNPIIAIGDVGASILKTISGDGLLYWQLFWQQYLYKNGLKLVLSYDKSKTNPKGALAQIKLNGQNNSFMVGATLPWKVSFSRLFSLYARFSEFNGSLMYNSLSIYEDKIDVIRIGNNFSFYERKVDPNTNAMINFEYSRGLKSERKGGQSISSSSTEKNFNKFNSEIIAERRYKTSTPYYEYSIMLGLSIQKSFNPLLPSEEISFGGQEYGRGYDSGNISGDTGFIAKLELHSNIFSDLSYLKKIDPYIFCDGGKLYNHDVESSQPKNISALSAGAGININFLQAFNANLLVAKPLTREDQNLINEGKNGKPFRYYFSLGGSF
ncbi:MAG: ShlB/FhaC/HecB family hemolysin secretion/activation protein [Oligoflexia bacterium]|nr:ShlB/FhaC/HecB family hemolysin secretion/activation protein [Oligoflexia bacterium]